MVNCALAVMAAAKLIANTAIDSFFMFPFFGCSRKSPFAFPNSAVRPNRQSLLQDLAFLHRLAFKMQVKSFTNMRPGRCRHQT
jgi:hypothetical protein